jgi:3D (Asp-Asp-Asp) domain-containing protein
MRKRLTRKKMLAGTVVALLCLMLYQCHFVSRPWRKPDAVIEMKLTGYCACRSCCGWTWSWYGMPVYAYGPLKGKFKRIGITATGARARPGTVAVDWRRFPEGTIFSVPGYGTGIAQDTGQAIQGNHLDLFFWTHREAEDWGVQVRKVKVWLPR